MKDKIKFIIFIGLFIVLFNTLIVNAKNIYMPNFMDKYTVYKNGSNYIPDLSSYPFDTPSAKSISFDKLYGDNKLLIEYCGEIPYSMSQLDQYKNYRTFNGEKIDGIRRMYSLYDDVDIDPNNMDPHIRAMTVRHDSFNFGIILYYITYALNFITTFILNLMISFKSINLSNILNELDKDGQFRDILAKIFLIDPENGTLSPLFLFALILFIFSLVSLVFKFLKGNKSFKLVINEFGYFIIALIVSAIFLTSNNASSIGLMGMDFMTKFSNELTTTLSPSTKIFECNTYNPNVDAVATQKALINKIYIDQIIYSQFGYPINELYITKPDGSVGGFGDLNRVQRAIESVYRYPEAKPNRKFFSVFTDINGENGINNLGYYFWAANSNVYINNFHTNNEKVFYHNNGKIAIRNGSSDRILGVIDFLANLREEAVYYRDTNLVNKIDKIIGNFMQPSYTTAAGNILLVSILNGAMSYSLFYITIFCLIGEIIIMLGGFAMVLMPPLLLFNKTRETAKRMMWSYLFGFIRFIVGTALFNTVITTSVLLSEQGTSGILVAIIICIALAKFGPNLIKQLDIQLVSMGRGKEFSGMSRFYNNINNKLYNRKRNSDYRVLNKDGEVTTKSQQKYENQNKMHKHDDYRAKIEELEKDKNKQQVKDYNKDVDIKIDNEDIIKDKINQNNNESNDITDNEEKNNEDINYDIRVDINDEIKNTDNQKVKTRNYEETEIKVDNEKELENIKEETDDQEINENKNIQNSKTENLNKDKDRNKDNDNDSDNDKGKDKSKDLKKIDIFKQQEKKKEKHKIQKANFVLKQINKIPVAGEQLNKSLANNISKRIEKDKIRQHELIYNLMDLVDRDNLSLEESFNQYKNDKLNKLTNKRQKRKEEKELNKMYKKIIKIKLDDNKKIIKLNLNNNNNNNNDNNNNNINKNNVREDVGNGK